MKRAACPRVNVLLSERRALASTFVLLISFAARIGPRDADRDISQPPMWEKKRPGREIRQEVRRCRCDGWGDR